MMAEGILLLNKPTDLTSFDCIRALKKLLPRKTKIGHAGTLDPFAHGLMIIAIGRSATKHLSAFMGQRKTYVATAQLGMLTDTMDITGAVVAATPPQDNAACSGHHLGLGLFIPSEQSLRDALISLQPSYEQIPPTYAALKHKGTPLYELVRRNKITDQEASDIVASKKRTVRIYEARFDSYAPPEFGITATVSKGTYIRCLMNDIARRASSCATTLTLARTAIGPFRIHDALALENLSEQTLTQHLMPIDEVLPRIALEEL